MFTRVRDASKVALALLVDRLRSAAFSSSTSSILTAAHASLGAVEIPRASTWPAWPCALECPATFS